MAMLETLRQILAQTPRLSVAILVKDNPYLCDFRPLIIEAQAARIWTFPRAAERNHVLLQWTETKQQVVKVGRRQKVVTSTASRISHLTLPAALNVKEAGFVGKEGGRKLVVAGDAEDGSLWLAAYYPTEAGWQPAVDDFASLPDFLRKNLCGHVGFRAGDMIFNVGRMVEAEDSAGNKRFLPEAESATYKFLVKQSESGYTVHPNVVNLEAFAVVGQFMQSVGAGRPDKSLLVDPRLAAIPKYLALVGKPVDSGARVVEMYMPPGRGYRFRLVSIGKDDLIFDVAKIKGVNQIKAIFVAPPDPFLSETRQYFPTYARLLQEPAVSAPGPADPAAKPASPAGTTPPVKPKKPD